MNEKISAVRTLKSRDKNIDWHYLLMIFCIVVAYAVYLPKHLSVDSWAVENLYTKLDQMQNGHLAAVWEEAKFSCFSAGRFFRGLIFLAFAGFRKAGWLIMPWVNWVAILFMCLSGMMMWKVFKRALVNCSNCSAIVYICCLITICNPFFTDWMQYIECQVYHPLALFLSILSASVVLQPQKNSCAGGKTWFAASILLILSGGLYQVALQFFVLVSVGLTFLSLRDAKGREQVIRSAKKFTLALSVYAVAAVVQLAVVSTMHSGRIQKKNIIEIVDALFTAQVRLWSMISYTQNPVSILFPVLAVILTVRIVRRVACSEYSCWEKIMRLVIIFVGFCGYYMSLFLPLVVSELWFPQRSMVGFWGILLVLAVAGECIDVKTCNAHLGIENLICILASVLLLSNLSSSIRFGTDLYRVNTMDKIRGELIVNAISDYEEESGVKIDKIAFRQDAVYSYTYPGIVNSFENNQAAWSVSWNYLPIIELVSGRDFEQCEYPKEIFDQYYDENVNWNKFELDQIHFINNTAYVMIY